MSKLKNKEIAEILGISTASVSLAINHKPGVSEATRARVFELLGTEYNSLSKNEINLEKSLLLVIHKKHGKIIIDKPFFSDLIESIQTTAKKEGYSLELSHYNSEMDLEQYIDTLRNKNNSGIILLATEMLAEDLEHYKKLSVPLILLDSSFEFEPFDAVTIDNQIALMNAVKYAYQMGHRNIGYLRSSVFINNFQDRYDGFLNALHRFDLLAYEHPIIALPCNIDDACTQMKEYLQHKPLDFKMPTCFVSDLDYIAIGAMRALQEMGYRIPQDISIIGFDDVTACEVCFPQLTTVRVNRTDIGAEAVKILLSRINTPHDHYMKVLISSEFIVRDSVLNLN